MKIREFAVEMWMNRYETQCSHNLAETCVESLTIAELLALAGRTEADLSDLMSMKLTYGAIEGSPRLRSLIASLYEQAKPGNVLVTHGAIGANDLVHRTIVEPGDRVISVVPTYQQHTAIPESYGADVRPLRLREENAFLPDLGALRELATPGTRLIAVNNPNNPTGSVMNVAMLRDVVAIARSCGAWLLCDEVYRGTAQEGDGMTPSIVDLYERGISTGSMSKTFSLAGLRLGWIVAPADLVHRVTIHRDYNTISVGMIDDYFASLALEAKDDILERSRAISRTNLSILSDWVDSEPRIGWVKPRGGTTAMLRYDAPVGSESFCLGLLQHAGVLLVPGTAFDMEGHVRIGFCNNETVLREGLSRMGDYLKRGARAGAQQSA